MNYFPAVGSGGGGLNKVAGKWIDHSPLSSVEAKSQWICTSPSPYALVMDTGKTLLFPCCWILMNRLVCSYPKFPRYEIKLSAYGISERNSAE
jgi:hypothetical protein